MHVGLFECASVIWPRGAWSVTLPVIKKGEATELVRIRLTLGRKAVSWLQLVKLKPPPDEERDREAIGNYLNVRAYLSWIKSKLTGASDNAEGGDWKEPEKFLREQPGKKRTPGWWAPTLEDILRAWARVPKDVEAIDRDIQHFKMMRGKEIKKEDRKIIEDFEKTWQVLRGELISGAK